MGQIRVSLLYVNNIELSTVETLILKKTSYGAGGGGLIGGPGPNVNQVSGCIVLVGNANGR
jgi:hypothetical protein